VSWSDSGAPTGPHEISLIAKIAARNDDDAARRLYRKYRMELFRFGVHVLNDYGLAEEMVQETFIKFCQRAGSYDATRGPVRAWLFAMARSAAIDIARRPSSRPLLPVEDFQLPPQYDTVDEALTGPRLLQDWVPGPVSATLGGWIRRRSPLPVRLTRSCCC
jgi:RNA polymerase sigma-70 factor, ECF subfamily